METDTIKLNVGGTLFEATRRTLAKASFFMGLFKTSTAGTSEPVFIDRSPHIFKHVLSYLRDSHYPYPDKYESELEYFGICYNHSDRERDGSNSSCERDDCGLPRVKGLPQCKQHNGSCSKQKIFKVCGGTYYCDIPSMASLKAGNRCRECYAHD